MRPARHAARFAAVVFVLGVPFSHSTGAQESGAARAGRIVGRVVDARDGRGISEVQIQVVGTTLGTISGVDGRFAVLRVPAGTVTLHARRLGWVPKTVTGILLDAGKTFEQNISIEEATVTLATTIVTASAERGTVNEALNAQKGAVGIVSAVTTEQIARSPDSDAAQAMQRVSGVTVQRGGAVFVRGLGERYTTTQLNGTRVPSPDPEKRTVPLDLFPSSLLEAITTSKTFTPDQQGDFSGAQLEIKTREFPAARQLSMQVTTGANTGATGKDGLSAFTVGGELLASVGSSRELPALIRSLGNFQGITLNQADKNLLIGQFRNAWTPRTRTASPNASTSLSIGGNDPVLGQRIGYLVSGTYSYAQDRRSDQVRAQAVRGSTPGSTVESDRFEGETGSAGVLWGGLANFSTLIGRHSRLMLNNTYTRTADNDARREFGFLENEALRVRIDRMQYVERAVRSTQFGADHQFGEAHRVDWMLTSSRVQRDEPDRTEFVSVIEQDIAGGPEVLRWMNTGNAGAVRTFSELDERNGEARFNYQLTRSALGRTHTIKVGGLHRATDRFADTRAFAITAPLATTAMRELPAEQLFDGRFTDPSDSVFNILPLAQGGAYDARDELSAGYVMADIGLNDRVRLIGGARYERDRMSINAKSTLEQPVRARNEWTDLLPMAAVNIAVTTAQNVRISVSRTLARPEYRELVPIKSRDVLNGDDLEGNPALARTRIGNADVRWEWYPNSGELLSVGLFVKHFDQPIERVYRAAGANSRFIGFVNAKSADNYGLEVELRKGLGFLASPLGPFSVFSNVTLMWSEIDLGAAQSAATNTKRRMVGQAPYVLNLGLGYVSATGNTSATLLYNKIGSRIEAAGDLPLPDVVQQPRDMLDLSVRFPVLGAVSGRFDAKNLLDQRFETLQGTVTREAWRNGRVVQLGIVVKS